MKKIFSIILLLAAVFPMCVAQEKPKTLFLYPTAPEYLTDFRQKCNYSTWHFWDNANLKSAFSSRLKMKEALQDFISLAVHASPDTTYATIDKLIENVRKTPANMLTLGELAEEVLFSDSAEIYSEELYLPFAKGVAETKKIPSANRLRFERQARILGHTQVGMIAPDFTFTKPDGSKGKLSDGLTKRTILIFHYPDCDDCRMTLVRLSADYNLRELIEKGYLNVFTIYPAEPDKEWKDAVSSYPETWIKGASADVDEMYDISETPTILYLDPNGKILSKTIDKSRLINMIRMLNMNVANPKKTAE